MTVFHRLGGTRQSAEAGGVFQWFGLALVESLVLAPDRTAFHYRPTGEAFHHLAEVVLEGDAAGSLSGIELRLARSFIEDPRNGIFARDIAKSLLRDGLSASTPELDDLRNEIEFPRALPIGMIRARPAPVLSEAASPGYEVFLGLRDLWECRCADWRVSLRNEPGGQEPWFSLVVK